MCGIFGIYGHDEAVSRTYLGLHALQHRGQESAGIVASDGETLRIHRGMGQVSEIFGGETVSKTLKGRSAIGHVRYSTTGESHLMNVQPVFVSTRWGSLAVSHNGNLVNTRALHEGLEATGSLFQTTIDTELFVHLIARSKGATIEDRIADALQQASGAYSLLFLTENKLIAARDPHGFRPLLLGRLDKAYVLASESNAFDLMDATLMREVEPGEMIIIDETGIQSRRFAEPARQLSKCIFEYVYFARPDSMLFGISVLTARRRMGRQLATEQPADADIVIPVPDSGFHAAMGYAEQSRIPFEIGLVRSHYVGRTFIQPGQSQRIAKVKLKLNAVRSVVEGKRVVVIDDSIVRGTTSKQIVQMIRDAGAREVHMRISSPPTVHPCFYGIDTPNNADLIAANMTIDEICRFLKADSLGYLSVEGLHKAVDPGDTKSYCNACFTGKYPIPIPPRDAPQMTLGV